MALWTTAAAAAVLVVVALWLVPWSPVPGSPVTPVEPEGVFTPAQIDRAETFSQWARVWGWSSLAVSLAVACWLGFGRRGQALVDRLPGPWWLTVVLTVAALELLGRLVTLPLGVAAQRLALDYGLSTQSWGGYAVDLLKGEAVTIVVTSVGVVFLLGCARRWRRAWPAVAGGGLAALVLLGSFVYPLVVEPLFNSFEPLPEGPLRTEILQVAAAEDVRVDDVLVADASRRTTTLNAYVSGFGGTRRVVVYDNLVDDLPREQALSVVAHELAHARHGDVVTGSVLGAAGAALGVGLLALVVGALARRGRAGMSEVGVVPLVLALAAIATLASAPVQNGVSRQIETRADVDALRATDDADAFAEMQARLAVRSLADPTPPAWSQVWFGSHPTSLTRIAVAERLGAP